ncbi:Crp/Fnr family transcriptional regulator [Pedobacter sp. Hv1]|uniref:Crp/Fnr family transcriptional regulator n=1 Tax=Pedobacter sp. Hv1 TaxID=1740090 RepID=UPI0006D8A253|nr:Crp/Fnr family transcriptional regulator [Pedobacter sp. Hv1]KQC00826.1 Crp/Fnr family transcriptional regulator [Pedobacter sp. Hv1]
MTENFNKYGASFFVDEAHFEELFLLLKSVTLKKNNFFLKSGEKCKYLGFVESGTMRSYYINENGIEKNFDFYFDRNFFTDYESILCNTKSNLNIQALEETKILLLNKEDLQKLYLKEAYWQEFGRVMAERIFLNAKKRIEDLLYYSPERRYTNLLKEAPLVFEKIPQKLIASYLGITPQSLSRIRNRITH